MSYKIIITLCVFSLLHVYADITGIYLLPKDIKNQESLVEIFKKGEKFYGVGFALKDGGVSNAKDLKNPDRNLQDRLIRGSVFLWLDCKDSNVCTGKIYSFDKGKIYPIKTTFKDAILQIKIDVLFGPTLEWKKLSKAESAPFNDKRLDINTLDVTIPKD